MWRPDPARLAAGLHREFGIAFDGRQPTGAGRYPGAEFVLAGPHPSDSFSLALTMEWRSLEVAFVPGPYAATLISQMGQTGAIARSNFSRFTETLILNRAALHFAVNGKGQDPLSPTSWPDEWSRLELRLKKSPATVNTEEADQNDQEVANWLSAFLRLVIFLIPTEIVEEDVIQPDGMPEGALMRVEVNRYERSGINRANCIAIHGCRCKACGFSFENSYGALGGGYIHVHHVTPVSKLGAGYIVDPWTDLVPLCPNCHAMVHRADPPMQVSELQKVIERAAAVARAKSR
jgi:5-methylcytosine-specific restriction protein A